MLEELLDKRDGAIRNARRQRARLLANPDYNQQVRPEFWEQVARDYAKQIHEERQRLKALRK